MIESPKKAFRRFNRVELANPRLGLPELFVEGCAKSLERSSLLLFGKHCQYWRGLNPWERRFGNLEGKRREWFVLG